MSDAAKNDPPGKLARLLAGYKPIPGVPDELLAEDGSIRPVWRSFAHRLADLPPDEVQARFLRGDQYLRDAGVFFRMYDDSPGSSERDWPLSHIPVLLPESDWREIEAGLIQRADLLEHVVADIYGANRLVARGHLPAALVAQNPSWLRPLVGVRPKSGHFLHFVGFEIGRGPDGRWWVFGDLTEMPGGAGFALENRVATSRVFPNFYAHANIHRLAGFFRAVQARLIALQGGADDRVALLSPGLMNDSYFEHAYIARYLGLLLVEGEDLVVEDGQVMVRTVAGPRPVHILWRRLAAAMTDPLELDETSHLGTAGLVEAVRSGRVEAINALGAGILETRALMAFLPQIARHHLGEDLALPNIATWWCGSPAERAHVLENRARMMIGAAWSTRPLVEDVGGTLLLGDAAEMSRRAIASLLTSRGKDLVGQEAVTLSTTPVWHGDGLVARPMCLRVFLARTAEGWQAMPGGYARVSAGQDATALAMQKGGAVADVWIVSDRPVPRPTLLGAGDDLFPKAAHDQALPARAADNLYWLGRYVERAETNMRLFRAYFGRRVEGMEDETPLLAFLRTRLMGDPGTDSNAMAALFEEPIASAMVSAGRVSDRFSIDGMMALKDLAGSAAKLHAETVPVEEVPARISELLRRITGFAGLVHENMYRSTGWRFLSLGMSIERAANMALILSELCAPDAPDGALDLALEVGDSTMTFRLRYSVTRTPATVIDLLALDPENPRSVQYHLVRAHDHIANLPRSGAPRRLSPAARLILQLHTGLSVETPETMTPATLAKAAKQLWRLSDLVSTSYFR